LKRIIGGYGWLHAISPLLFILFLSFLFPAETRANQGSYLDSLLQAARTQELAKESYWLTLLHYKKDLRGTQRSLIDDPEFFLSPDGKTDPEAEMEATLRAFFKGEDEEGRSPVCRFIARFEWLKERLEMDGTRLPVSECTHFREILEQVRPESVSLIFPTSHMNSPASMFGHTLLAIETAQKSKLLAHAVNYAAAPTDTFAPLFAAKGLLGFYKGYFSILPYYAKIQEYSDVDHRDIWEYSLNLNSEEITRLLMHVYELQNIYSDYFFLDENCSYVLLFLLDAARPTLNLTDQCNWWVIPVDTIKIVIRNDLVRHVLFRPSQTSKIRHIASLLTKKGRETAFRIADGELNPEILPEWPNPKEEKRIICDLAIEYLQYRYVRGDMPKDLYLGRFLNTLKVRSLFGSTEQNAYHFPPPDPPETGHGSHRFSWGIGVEGGDLFQEMRLRPALHHLLDHGTGFKEGAQIVFTDIALRHHFSENRIRLEKFDLIDIVSLSPRDTFFRPISWKGSTGFKRILTEGGDRRLTYNLNLGAGLAYRPMRQGIGYVFAEMDTNFGGSLKRNYAAGLGGTTGFITPLTDFWKIHLFLSGYYYPLGDTHDRLRAGFLQSFTLSRNMSLSAELSREKAYDEYLNQAVFYWNLFF
jgi:hypothetical protein